MSLRGRIAGAALLLSMVVIACKDELSTLGFRNPENKFKVVYKEIEIPTTVMRTDSLPTYNSPNFSSTQRLLIGRYDDPVFGEISATAFTQIRPSSPTFTLPDDATLVNGELYLSLDFYYYGTNSLAPVSFTIHELTDSLAPLNDDGLNSRLFFFNTNVEYDPKEIGNFSLEVNPTSFDQLRNDNAEYLVTRDTTKRHIQTFRSELDKDFVGRLFLAAKEKSNNYTVFSRFRQIFKGIALVPDATSQAIVGINPDYDETTLGESRIVLNYETFDADSNFVVTRQIEFGLFKYSAATGAVPNYQIGFSHINADRSGVQLAELAEVYQAQEVDPVLRFVQAGNPIVTRLDFGKFFEFSDTITALSLNSAELVISEIDASPYKPPDRLSLRILKENNRFDNSTAISIYYANSIAYDVEGKLIFAGDNSEQFSLNLSEKNGKYEYTGFLTSYLQLLYSIKSDSIRYRYYGLVPLDPEFGKSVNRVVFHKDSLKLRLYYTIPTSTR